MHMEILLGFVVVPLSCIQGCCCVHSRIEKDVRLSQPARMKMRHRARAFEITRKTDEDLFVRVELVGRVYMDHKRQ